MTALSLFATISTNITLIHAEDSETNSEYTEDGESNTEMIPDYDTSGYEAWLPDYNPRSREMYGGYNRAGNFIICEDNTGNFYSASEINVKWEQTGNSPTTQYFNASGRWVKKTSDLTAKEYANVEGTFTLKRNCTEFKAPIANPNFKTGRTLPAGNYQVRKEAMQFVEIGRAHV